MKATKETVSDIAQRIVIIYKHANKPIPQDLSERELWLLWHQIYQETTYPLDYPIFKNRDRCLQYNPDFSLYPNDTNDKSMTTALRAAHKLALTNVAPCAQH